MARVLFVNGGLEGHVNPTLGLVRELTRRGEEVTYVTTEPMRPRLEAAGARVRTVDGHQLGETMRTADIRNFVGVSTGLLRCAALVIPHVLQVAKEAPVDYIIHDTILGSGRIAAQLLQVPAVASCTTFARSPEVVGRMLHRLAAQTTEAEYGQLMEQFGEACEAVHQQYGVTVDSVYEAYCNPAPLTLVYTSRRFQPGGEGFGDAFKFVGPTAGSAPAAGADPMDLGEATGSPLVYISLGTLFSQAPAFYRFCFDALGGRPYRVILSAGAKTALADLEPIPPNFVVKNYVPQLEVLEGADVFITHGGMNSVSEGLLNGVPLVVFPQGADQFDVAARVAELGAGVSLRQPDLSPAQLRGHIDGLLADSAVRAVSRELGESLVAAGGAARAADEVLAFAASVGAGG